MNNLKKEYQKEDLTISWEPGKCIHSENCWRGLIEVFNPKKKPWINVDGASKDRIMAQIDKCPSGALGYSVTGQAADSSSPSAQVTIAANGPYLVNGPVDLIDASGNTKTETRTVALCRCGHSTNKPYCDGSHKKHDFVG
ncbi:(4Fe-4S)-binding protein [Cryomorphaceae bacterium]|nr:(4Fe-4S)-binding protein [Cryomorphaceae bacterium]